MKKRMLGLIMVLMVLSLSACSKPAQTQEAGKWDCTVTCAETSEHDSYVITYSPKEVIPESGVLSLQNINEFDITVHLLTEGEEERVAEIKAGGVSVQYQMKTDEVYQVGCHADVEEGVEIGLYVYDGPRADIDASSDETDKGTSEAREPAAEADRWGITLSAEDVTPTGLTLIVTQSGGNPTGELLFGSDYTLKVWEHDAWEDVPYIVDEDSVAWTSEAYMVPTGGSAEQEIAWEYLYGSLPAGRYRMIKGFSDFRAAGDFDEAEYSVEFELHE